MAIPLRPLERGSRPRPPVVHVVDDDPAFRTAIGNLLRACDYRVELHASATDLLEKPPGKEPACTLLDVRMAGCSEPAAAGSSRRPGGTPPIIFVTGYGDLARYDSCESEPYGGCCPAAINQPSRAAAEGSRDGERA